ncbi:hypothetical protein LTR28_008518 [Elasticomyces elasticus]|nr:hypothetical protein LTR28_008518 [Elasticomyces elasticus]
METVESRFEKLVDEYEEQRRIEKRHEQRQRQSDDALAEKEIIKMMRKKLGTKEDLEARMARHAQLTKAAKMIIVCNHFMENYVDSLLSEKRSMFEPGSPSA